MKQRTLAEAGAYEHMRGRQKTNFVYRFVYRNRQKIKKSKEKNRDTTNTYMEGSKRNNKSLFNETDRKERNRKEKTEIPKRPQPQKNKNKGTEIFF